jgi:GINS complex subunit 4
MDTADLFETSIEESLDVEEEEFTAAEVLQKLEDAWLNEKHSPELLEPKMEIVECMLDQVNTMEENLTKLKKGDLRTPVHRMELSRIRFMINSYLRIRLEKIQRNIHSVTRSDQDNPDRLTDEERQFAASHRDNTDTLFSALALRHTPGQFEPDKVQPKMPELNLGTAVFVKVREDVQGVDILDETGQGRDDTIDLSTGSQHLVKYSAVSHLVNNGSLQLI